MDSGFLALSCRQLFPCRSQGSPSKGCICFLFFHKQLLIFPVILPLHFTPLGVSGASYRPKKPEHKEVLTLSSWLELLQID